MKFLEHVDGFINGNLRLGKTILSLVKLEAQLAGLSIYPLLLNVCFLFIIGLATWCSLMALIGYFIFFFVDNGFLSIAAVLLINLIFLIIFLKNLQTHLKNMSFENTRAFFSGHKQNQME